MKQEKRRVTPNNMKRANLWCVSRGGLWGWIHPLIPSENKPPQDDVKDENLREISVGIWKSADCGDWVAATETHKDKNLNRNIETISFICQSCGNQSLRIIDL